MFQLPWTYRVQATSQKVKVESYPPTGGARTQDGGVPANININNPHHQHIKIPARRSKAIRTWTLCTPTQGTHLHQLDLAAAMVRIAKDPVLVNPDAQMEIPGTSSWGGSCLPLRLWRQRFHRQMQHLLRPLRILLPTKGEALTKTLLYVVIHTTRYINKVHQYTDANARSPFQHNVHYSSDHHDSVCLNIMCNRSST